MRVLPERQELDRLFRLDLKTGKLYWRYRPEYGARWNGRYAWKDAGSLGGSGYVQVKIDGRKFLTHRIVWRMCGLDDPDGDLDHKDLDKTNNRIENLRAATRSQNRGNTPAQQNNTLGMKGVYALPNGKFGARIKITGKVKHLGTFDTREEAAAAYWTAAQGYFGNYARAV